MSLRFTILLSSLLAIFACGQSAGAQTPYPRLQQKAERFFNQKEWAQAAATYYQMLEQRPDVAGSYGKAIVANAIIGDTISEMSLMGKAMQNKVPFDSVLSNVKQASFSLGRSNLYGDFLLRVREAYPWMRRPIDNYLLKYYIYRHDGARMMEYGEMMLKGAPGNVGFLTAYAQGAVLCGDYAKGMDAYERILAADPDNYDALLALGNYYYMQCRNEVMPPDEAVADGVFPPVQQPKKMSREERDRLHRRMATSPAGIKAREYLTRAEAVKPTPHVKQMLETLRPHRER